jgi:hypothetical protein
MEVSRVFLKKVKLTVHVLSVFALILLIFPASSISREAAPQEVIRAAIDGLRPFLEAIPGQDLEHYGFASPEELARATLGKPFKVYTITPDKILNYSQEMKLSTVISPTNLWFFPVVYRGKVRTILTVDFVDGEWRAVAIGSSGLAKQLERIENKWPESDGYDHRFIRIYQAQSDFVAVSKERILKIVPLESAAVALKLKKVIEGVYGLYSPSEMIPKLVPVVRENLQSQTKSVD